MCTPATRGEVAGKSPMHRRPLLSGNGWATPGRAVFPEVPSRAGKRRAMKKIVLFSAILLAAGAGLLPLGCGKNLDPARAVALAPTIRPTPTPSATPQPGLSISWIGLPTADSYPYGSGHFMTTLQLILQAQGQEAVSVSQMVFGGTPPPSLNPPLLIPDNLVDDPSAEGNYFYMGSTNGYPGPVATGSWSVTDVAFTGIQDLILAPAQPQTLLLVFDFQGNSVLQLPPAGNYFSILTTPPITAYGVSTGLPATVTGGPIIGNIQGIAPAATPQPQPTQQGGG